MAASDGRLMSAKLPALPGRFRGFQRSKAVARAGLVTPGLALLILFALLPLVALVVSGFLNADAVPTLENFEHVFSSGTYVTLLQRTSVVAFLVTLASIALGWPAAWALARYTKPERRPLILGLVIVPYISSQLLLIYGFLTLIQAGGPISALLSAVHLVSPDDSILYTPWATFLMLVYESLPTAVLVMYSASESIQPSVLEAARTLGTRPIRVFTRVIWPLSAGMLVVNFTLTFVQTVGAFAEPVVLGGPNGAMLGNAIASQLSAGVNQGFAVALALVLLATSLSVVAIANLAVTTIKRWQAGDSFAFTRRAVQGERHRPISTDEGDLAHETH
ncbi:ABC transporter permease [Paenarthrobacter sp. NPDC058040]|uniref:ABC transporter permease n=1 Tax=unclassified Paenarthrobacter TaxID=2634190 RepID=UPI0036DBD06D